VNFALLHLFGYRFAPRYRDFRHKIESGLYGFENRHSANAKLFLEPLEGIAGLSRPIFDGVDADIRVEHVFIQGICVISI